MLSNSYLYSMYLVKTPWWLRALYPGLTWRIRTREKVIYLTFDDGPHETATPFVLEQLKQYGAKATFFCIGKNVAAYPAIYQRILDEGHTTGNHTYHHLNGWKISNETYLADIAEAGKLIWSPLFRPPYGRLSREQIRLIHQLAETTKEPGIKRVKQIIMWDVLSGDFDTNLTPEACLAYVLYHARPGSIIVFHDSTKAWEKMSYALPKVLDYFSGAGYQFKSIH